jgi:hypothetical protein
MYKVTSIECSSNFDFLSFIHIANVSNASMVNVLQHVSSIEQKRRVVCTITCKDKILDVEPN